MFRLDGDQLDRAGRHFCFYIFCQDFDGHDKGEIDKGNLAWHCLLTSIEEFAH
jgi:hypothetical protein